MANGDCLSIDKALKDLHWYCHGHTFTTTMIVVDMLPYDAILGYDWLKANNPMQCNWQAKTLQFEHKGQSILL